MDNIFNKNYNHQVDPNAVKEFHQAIDKDIRANGGTTLFINNIIELVSAPPYYIKTLVND